MRPIEQVEKENNILRGLVAKVVPTCHYCQKDFGHCPHGFPGCPLADDLMCGDDEQLKSLVERLREKDEALEKLKKSLC